jgi:hypothetical protein
VRPAIGSPARLRLRLDYTLWVSGGAAVERSRFVIRNQRLIKQFKQQSKRNQRRRRRSARLGRLWTRNFPRPAWGEFLPWWRSASAAEWGLVLTLRGKLSSLRNTHDYLRRLQSRVARLQAGEIPWHECASMGTKQKGRGVIPGLFSFMLAAVYAVALLSTTRSNSRSRLSGVMFRRLASASSALHCRVGTWVGTFHVGSVGQVRMILVVAGMVISFVFESHTVTQNFFVLLRESRLLGLITRYATRLASSCFAVLRENAESLEGVRSPPPPAFAEGLPETEGCRDVGSAKSGFLGKSMELRLGRPVIFAEGLPEVEGCRDVALAKSGLMDVSMSYGSAGHLTPLGLFIPIRLTA